MTPEELPEALRAELAQATDEARRVWGGVCTASLVQQRSGWRACVLAGSGSPIDGTYRVKDTPEQVMAAFRSAVRRATKKTERAEAERIAAGLRVRNLGATVSVAVGRLADRTTTSITARVTGEGWEERVGVTGDSLPKAVEVFWRRLRAR